MLAAVALAVLGKGAFYRQGQLLSAGVLALAVVLTVATSRGRPFARGVPRSIMLVVASLLAFGLWATVRGALAGDGTSGVVVLAFAAALSGGVVMGHLATSPQRTMLRHAIIGLGALSGIAGWAGVVWRINSLALPGSYVWRASGTLTYENALACLLVLTALVTVAVLVERWTPAAATALCLMLVGAAATQSRGGALALLCGAATLVACLGWRPVLDVAWRPAAGAVVAAAGLVPSAPVLAPARPLPAVVALCAGVVVAAWPRRRRAPVPRVVVAVVALLSLTLAGAGLALRVDPAALTSLESRLTLNSRHRAAQHRAAVAELASHPVIGTGPGQADLRWRQGRQTLRARFVHNEYLQVAVELGMVGAVLLLAVLAAIGHALWLARAAGGAPWAGVAAALVATAVYGSYDFVWHLPAIPFIAVLLAGTATVPNEASRERDPDHTPHPTP